jgi:hypothetical protein
VNGRGGASNFESRPTNERRLLLLPPLLTQRAALALPARQYTTLPLPRRRSESTVPPFSAGLPPPRFASSPPLLSSPLPPSLLATLLSHLVPLSPSYSTLLLHLYPPIKPASTPLLSASQDGNLPAPHLPLVLLVRFQRDRRALSSRA